MGDDQPLLDWTLSEAPPPDPADTAAPAPNPLPPPTHRPSWTPRRLSRLQWLLIGSVVGLALLSPTGIRYVNLQRARTAIQQAVMAEDESLRRGDLEALAEIYHAADRPILLTGMLPGAFALPLPHPSAFPANAPPFVRSVVLLDANLARAEVGRQYRMPDSTLATYAMAQFYRFSEGAWRRTITPSIMYVDFELTRGQFVTIEHYPEEAEYAQQLRKELDDYLAEVCLAWGCRDRPPLIVRLYWPANTGAAFTSPTTLPSLVLSAASNFTFGPLTDRLDIPTPAAVGVPLDAPAADWLRRSTAARVLALAARRQMADTGNPDNLFLYALVARQAAHLGIEPAAILSITITSPHPNLPAFWEPQRFNNAYSDLFNSRLDGLAILNGLLADAPPEAETQLAASIWSAPNPQTWLAGALGGNIDQRIQTIVETPPPQPTGAGQSGDLALVCADGISLWEAATNQLRLSIPYLGVSPLAWSPDGRRLLVSFNQRRAVVDLDAGVTTWLPTPPGLTWTSFGWVSSEVLAFTVRPATTTGLVNNSDHELHLISAKPPHQTLSIVPGIIEMAASPKGGQLAVVGLFTIDSINTYAVALLNPNTAEPTVLRGGRSPVWSPDGSKLLFITDDTEQPGPGLVVVEVATLEQHVVLTGAEVAPANGVTASIELGFANPWAADGSAITFFVDGAARIGVLRLDDGSVTLFEQLANERSYGLLSLSHNGALLTHTQLVAWPLITVTLTELATGRQRVIPGQLASWSPDGHQLMYYDADGVFLLEAATALTAEPRQLAPAGCSGWLWRT